MSHDIECCVCYEIRHTIIGAFACQCKPIICVNCSGETRSCPYCRCTTRSGQEIISINDNAIEEVPAVTIIRYVPPPPSEEVDEEEEEEDNEEESAEEDDEEDDDEDDEEPSAAFDGEEPAAAFDGEEPAAAFDGEEPAAALDADVIMEDAYDGVYAVNDWWSIILHPIGSSIIVA